MHDAIDSGVRLALDSDAHTVDELRFVERYGIGVAHLGWAQKNHIVNTMHLEELLVILKGCPERVSK